MSRLDKKHVDVLTQDKYFGGNFKISILRSGADGPKFSSRTSLLNIDHTSKTLESVFQSILFDIKIATPACFLSPFDWKAFSQPFTLSGLVIMRRGDFFFFLIQSIWCSVGFLNLHRVSITFFKSFLVMDSASSALTLDFFLV
ncbi:hypothetical protein STEG23_034856 [Scotinomys teguina]